ncbi:MAG: carboxypeptidase regulatory-like domain-containing protein [bacterium]
MMRIIAATVFAAFSTLAAQSPSPRADSPRTAVLATIDGLVADSALTPIAGASVSILQTAVQVETEASGRFRILQVPAGQYLIVVRRVGYHPVSGIIEVGEGENLKLSYTMSRLLTTLDTVRVAEQRLSMKMSEFEQRRKWGFGHFVTREEIEKRNVPMLSDMVRGVLGFSVGTDGSISSSRGAVAINGRRCAPTVFIDGIRFLGAPTDVNLPSIKEIAGMEFYSGPASAPLQYGKVGMCGVIILWTKDGGP